MIGAVQTDNVNDPVYVSRNDSDDDNTEILDVLETIDISELPTLKEPAAKAEQIYLDKVMQAVGHANRFANLQCMH